MSNAVYPTLPGLSWSVIKRPVWKTSVQQSVSGKESRAAFMSYPNWEFTLAYEFLRSGAAWQEFQRLADFFNARQGQFDSFLFDDPSDDTVTAMQFGTGDGSTRVFQLTRTLYAGGFVEPIQNLNATPTIYDNAVAKTAGVDYTISSLGVVTFTVAPTAGHALTWTGTFYYRCRFMMDAADFENFMGGLWSTKKVQFRSIKQ